MAQCAEGNDTDGLSAPAGLLRFERPTAKWVLEIAAAFALLPTTPLAACARKLCRALLPVMSVPACNGCWCLQRLFRPAMAVGASDVFCCQQWHLLPALASAGSGGCWCL